MTTRRAFYKIKTVLVVDDSDQIRSYLKSMLLLIGFEEVVLARDADVALSCCRRMSFDFILCDYKLGHGRDGYQLFEVLRSERLLKAECCFLVVSAERQRQCVYGMIEYQPADYLLKPFSYAELERRIARAYHIRQALQPIYLAISRAQLAEAVTACDEVVAKRSQFAMHASRLKAELLTRLERYDEAEHLYLWTLTVRDFGWAKLGLAVTYGYQGRREEAEALLLELSTRAETKIEALEWLARLHISQNRPAEALAAIEVVAKNSPRNHQRQHVLANLAVIENQLELAVSVHQRLLTAARYSMHDTADNMLNYARAMFELAKQQPAKERAETLQRIDQFITTIKKRFHPSNFEHDRLVLAARMLLLEGKNDKALAHLAESEQLSLDRVLSAPAMLDRARAYLEVGDLAMSDHYIACLSTVAQDDSIYSSALDLLMHYEQQKQQTVRQELLAKQQASFVAIEYFRRELDKMPENINIALNLLQAISIRRPLTDELRHLAQRAVDVIIAGRLPHDQIKRYQVIMSHIQL
jgi:DNA-binding response OmpR family regulator